MLYQILLLFPLFSSLFGTPTASTQEQSLTGYWQGILTQNEGGYAEEYYCALLIVQEGDQISGSARVGIGEIFAEMTFTGYQLRNGNWRIEEDRLLRSEQPEYLEWCLKKYELKLGKRVGKTVLRGRWWGASKSGPCIPGNVEIWRPAPQV